MPETKLREVLDRVWRYEVKVKSDYARTFAEYIAMAASMSLITTRVANGVFAGAWQITNKGLTWLNETDK